jgi:NADH:ubiquinone oxidoreductase subunit 3 (subunit A)
LWNRVVYLDYYPFFIFLVRKEWLIDFKYFFFGFYILFALVLIFYFLFIFLNYFIYFKSLGKFSVSYFESGFDGVLIDQNFIRVHFFLIIVLFVVFDLELVMFVGFLLVDRSYYYYFFIFFFVVMRSFYLEFFLGKLVWVY